MTVQLSGGMYIDTRLSRGRTPPATISRLFASDTYNAATDADTGRCQTSDSSDESNSPTEHNTYKGFSEKPPLIKRICMGISGGITGCGLLGDTGKVENKNNTIALNICSTNSCQTRKQYVNEHVTEYNLNSNNEEEVSSRLENTVVNREERELQNRFQEDESIETTNLNLRSQQQPTQGSTNYTSEEFRSDYSPSTQNQTNDSADYRTVTEDGDLKSTAWYQVGISREITLEVLRHKPVGSFVVRESTSKPGCYALSLRVSHDLKPSGLSHYLIVTTNKGYKFKGSQKEFSSLSALITHHSVMQEFLPCPLSISRQNTTTGKQHFDSDFAYMDEQQDYDVIADFRQMLEDIKL